jgi:hypothetical protein
VSSERLAVGVPPNIGKELYSSVKTLVLYLFILQARGRVVAF